jgi:hypothetical protein
VLSRIRPKVPQKQPSGAELRCCMFTVFGGQSALPPAESFMTIRNALLVLAVLGFASTPALAAQTVTAFKTGEQTTGMTKQCFYDALGNAYTLTIKSIELCPLSIQVRLPPTTAPTRAEPESRTTVTAFKTGEETTGMTKQCFYDALGNAYTRTIKSIELCPLSIQVRSP